MIDSVRQDVRYAIRTFRRSPGFAALLALLATAGGRAGRRARLSLVLPVLLLRAAGQVVVLIAPRLSPGSSRRRAGRRAFGPAADLRLRRCRGLRRIIATRLLRARCARRKNRARWRNAD